MKWPGLLLALACLAVAVVTLGLVGAETTVGPPNSQLARDAAVTDATADKYTVNQGDEVTITATVENKGTESLANIPFILRDATDNKMVAIARTDLEPNATDDIEFAWDTTQATLGEHSLVVLAYLTDDDDQSNNSFTLDAITVQAPGSPIDDPTPTPEPTPTPTPEPTPTPTPEPTPTPTPEPTPTPTPEPTPTPTPEPTPTPTPEPTPTPTPEPTPTPTPVPTSTPTPEPTPTSTPVPTPTPTPPPEIVPGAGDGFIPDAHHYGKLSERQPIDTKTSPLTAIFTAARTVLAKLDLKSDPVQPLMDSTGNDLARIFVANADATFGASTTMQDPFRNGEIRGTVKLDHNHSSLGAFLEVGDRRFFADSDGSFYGMVPYGKANLSIRAPGFLPVVIPDVYIDPGEVITIPEVTLPFGDGDGDGYVNMVDFVIAARNLGFTVQTVELPPP